MICTMQGKQVLDELNLRNRKCHGLTLIELICSLAILSIILVTGIPRFSNAIANVELKSTSLQLQSALNLARQYAITNSIPVNICALQATQKKECKSNNQFNSDWSDGWMVYADQNNNNQYDANDEIIKANQNSSNVAIVFNQRGRLRFFNDGSARSAGFYLCTGSTQQIRHIRLLFSGRSRISKTSTKRQEFICHSTRVKNK